MSAITQRLLLRSCISGLLIASYFSFSDLARAERVTIVALGASNTVGRGGTSYPAELEVLLKAKGYDVRVINAGVNGDTTAGMAARLDSAVPNGTRLVLLNPANRNDERAGIRGQQPTYIAQIRSRLSARGIKVIVLPSIVSMAGNAHHTDSEHFDAEGYRGVAARVLPQVMKTIGAPP
jgi:acyl-CoA thioesterase I